MSISEIEFGTAIAAAPPTLIVSNTVLQPNSKKVSLWIKIWNKMINIF
jgi:hypothetical protein